MEKGWVCPKCNRGVAPWKDSCNCQAAVSVPNYVIDCGCPHSGPCLGTSCPRAFVPRTSETYISGYAC